MRFLMSLLRNMLPLQYMVADQTYETPVGFDRVITNTGNYVVTVRNNYVIAKT